MSDAYEGLFRDIGEICVRWTAIEHLVHDLCLHGAWVLDNNISGGRKAWDIMHIALTNQAKIGDKIATARAILVTALGHEYPAAHTLLTRVAKAGEDRNRYVHDMWEMDGQTWDRFRLRTNVSRSAKAPWTVSIGTTTKLTPAEVKAFISTLYDLYDDLVTLDNRLAELASDPD